MPPNDKSMAITAAKSDRDDWLVDPSARRGDIRKAVSNTTYVGIDFGTSTSVVSVVRTDGDGRVAPRTLKIEQPEELGGTTDHHLVNTVLAWHRERLLFGQDAYRLRQELFEGKNVFSSFKMRLGVDIGPTYPETALREDGDSVTIENAGDAAREFFKLLAKGIKDALKKEGYPSDYRLVVSVPASFEANQRQDLLDKLQEAGLPASENCLIDEPNAAFLSFLLENTGEKGDRTWADRLRDGTTNILVYDFGAGTCDVSILEVGIVGGLLKSRNCAISRFTALGGDDFDRAIVRNALLGQLLESAPGFEPQLRDIEERLIPRLQPVAESLKIAAIKWLDDRGISTLAQIRAQSADSFEDLPVPSFKIRGTQLSLSKPTLTLKQLADAMEPLVRDFNPAFSTTHVNAPVADAIDKSGLEEDDIDAVLFIGGSAANQVVRATVMSNLPNTVKSIVPADLRTHVSLGAALHSLGFHALGCDLIQPITPEPIFVLARGEEKEVIIPASSEVPSRKKFKTVLKVEDAGQEIVELPICVSNTSKLLGLLKIESPSNRGFQKDEVVSVAASITHDKLLKVEAEVAGTKAEVSLLNPLANRELSETEQRMLEAKQEFNISLLDSRGRPTKEVVLKYALASYDAKAYETAADMFVAVERIDPTEDHATKIAYAYAQARQDKKTREWYKKAHQRMPNEVTAYNRSLYETGKFKEQLLRESRDYDPTDPAPMLQLGRILISQSEAGNQAEGKALLQECVQSLVPDLDHNIIDRWHCNILSQAAELLGKDKTARRAQERIRHLQGKDRKERDLYDEKNLAGTISRLPPPMLDD